MVLSAHDIVGGVTPHSAHDIVEPWLIMSPLRRHDEHPTFRTSPSPRGDSPPPAGRAAYRDLPRLGSQFALVRQVVGRIPAQSADRLCRPLAGAPYLAAPPPTPGRAGGRSRASDPRSRHHSPNPLWLDWASGHSGPPASLGGAALAQLGDDSTPLGSSWTDPPAGRRPRGGTVSVADRLGAQCDSRYRHHHPPFAGRAGDSALSHYRSLQPRRGADPTPRQDQRYGLRPSAADVGHAGLAADRPARRLMPNT